MSDLRKQIPGHNWEGWDTIHEYCWFPQQIFAVQVTVRSVRHKFTGVVSTKCAEACGKFQLALIILFWNGEYLNTTRKDSQASFDCVSRWNKRAVVRPDLWGESLRKVNVSLPPQEGTFWLSKDLTNLDHGEQRLRNVDNTEFPSLFPNSTPTQLLSIRGFFHVTSSHARSAGLLPLLLKHKWAWVSPVAGSGSLRQSRKAPWPSNWFAALVILIFSCLSSSILRVKCASHSKLLGNLIHYEV